uniref:Receptor-type protein kinase n=1 Tax=Bodo saltans TaxID=75058 RepID=B6DTP3_BODSA|nr:receptor-type protein kinase [Bodo saltans]
MVVLQTCVGAQSTQQLLLQRFNESTGGASWYTTWSGSDMCSWYGVTCSSGTRDVIELSLASNNLRGGFPVGILQNLTSLETVRFGGNHLTGSLSAGLSALTSMKSFDISFNSIAGTLPPELGSSWLALVLFKVNNNQLRGGLPASYSNWTSLSEFSVWSNYLSGSLPASYSSWSSLQTFACQDNGLSGTLHTSYGQGTKLQPFGVSRNQFNGTLPSEFGRWVNLNYFDVSTNSLTGVLPENYQQWVGLTQFIAAWNSISGTLPAVYSAWSQLSVFYMSINRLSGTLPSVYSNWTLLTTQATAVGHHCKPLRARTTA